MWRVEVEEAFSAAHALRCYQGKCERPHGHNFTVAVTVEGSGLQPGTELLIDFKTLRGLLKGALEGLDHRMLNEQAPFDAINPSSENLAAHIWGLMAAALAACPEGRSVRLRSVSVSEKPGQRAVYMEGGEG